MNLFKIFCKDEDTQIMVEADNENDALNVFKRQVAYKPGISKSVYRAELYKKL